MIILSILTTSLIHFSLNGLENVLFELGSQRVNQLACSRLSDGERKTITGGDWDGKSSPSAQAIFFLSTI